jgi:hypothetical protein
MARLPKIAKPGKPGGTKPAGLKPKGDHDRPAAEKQTR